MSGPAAQATTAAASREDGDHPHDTERNEATTAVFKVRSSLERALASNRKLQATVLLELAGISRLKAANRAAAERLRQQLSDESSSECATRAAQERRSNSRNNNTQEFGTYGDWQRPFFTGPEGDAPEPNSDAARRQRLEAATFLEHSQPPWSAAETKALQTLLPEEAPGFAPSEEADPPPDYDALARRLHAALPPKQQEGRPVRTATELKLAYQSWRRRRNHPWTKTESVKLCELVHASDQSASPRDWAGIASALSESGPYTRTAWECLVVYQTRLRPVASSPWTLPQDRLLLKYAAAAGPQCVLSTDAVAHLSVALFADKTRPQIAHRLHHSLCNPKLSNDPWTADEERKLVMLMKVYHDRAVLPTDPAASNLPSGAVGGATAKALNLAAQHFPHRSVKSVTDKWRKSLDPGHSSLPFTAHEDQRLLDIVNQHPDVGWSELCERYFPDRHPERIAKRWADLAHDRDVLARNRGTAAAAAAAGARLLGARGTKSARDGRSAESSTALLTADDFVVQVKKKPKR